MFAGYKSVLILPYYISPLPVSNLRFCFACKTCKSKFREVY